MFDVEKTVEALKRWIIEWFDKTGPVVMLLSVFRGKDSSIVAALCAAALVATA